MDAGAKLEVDPDHAERAAYVMEGAIAIGDRSLPGRDDGRAEAGRRRAARAWSRRAW